jgi:hypothetical protein
MIGGYGPHIFAPATTANLGYDALTDFTHIAMIGEKASSSSPIPPWA